MSTTERTLNTLVDQLSAPDVAMLVKFLDRDRLMRTRLTLGDAIKKRVELGDELRKTNAMAIELFDSFAKASKEVEQLKKAVMALEDAVQS